MLKKWKKSVKLLATTIIVLIYVTIELFNAGTIKGGEKKNFDEAITAEKYSGTVKTIIGYSREFRMKEQLQGRIECEAENRPKEEEDEDRSSRWRFDQKLGIRIFSAYYDQREERYDQVRIIALLPRNSSFYCQIWYQNNETTTHVTQKAIIHEIWSPEWGPKERTCDEEYPAIISCLAPPQTNKTIPSWVSFVDKSCVGGDVFVKVTSPPVRPKNNKFIICVKPLHLTNVNSRSLLEWLEINHRLGAEEIVIYFSNSTETDLVLRDYKDGRLLVKKKFEIPQVEACPSRNFEESIWYKRKMEIVAYNDCFYSNLYHTKFVIPLDVDEIIVPKTGNNWFEAFRSHFLNGNQSEEGKNWPEDIENYSSFSVRNAYFFSRYPKDAIIRSLMLPKCDQNLPKKLVKALLKRRGSSSRQENVFDRTLRSYRLSPSTDSVKSFVHVAKTLSVFNHFTFHVLGTAARQFVFPEKVFQLNHYRNSCDPVLIDGCQEFLQNVTYDDSLEKFRRRKKAPME